MSRKRSLMPDIYRTRKRVCTLPINNQQPSDVPVNHNNNQDWNGAGPSNSIDPAEFPNDTNTALLYLKNIFPVEKFEGRLPPIIIKHQLYSIVRNRTIVDKEVTDMRNNGDIRLFKLGADANELCIVFTEDYKSHILKFTQDLSVSKTIVDKFLSTVVSQCQDISLSKHRMMTEFNFCDDEITQLVKACVLTVRDVGSWWLAIPSAGVFMKSFIRGRKAALTMIRKCKYEEILQQELEGRKLPRVARLGMTYHIHDIIGADLVECIATTSGQLLRLKE